MPSDHNPWNLGEGGNSDRPPPPPPPGGPWRDRPERPKRPLPPELGRLLDELRALAHRLQTHLGPGRLAGLAGLAALALWLATGFYRVQPDEQALVLQFGAYTRSAYPGLNWHIPWPVERVITLPVTRINRVTIGFLPADDQSAGETDDTDRDLREESLMLTGDENIVDINASVFWRISNAEAFAFNTRNPAGTVKAAAESVLRQVIGRTKIQSALTEGRAAIEQSVTTLTQQILDDYGSGVEITQVQLQKVDPPPEVIESFRDVQRANTDADRARNEAQAYANDIVPRARGDAAAIIAAAQGAKLATIAKAQGESQRFLSIYAAYAQAKDVTLKRLYIETMEDVLGHAQTIIVDDKLKGILPLIQLGEAK